MGLIVHLKLGMLHKLFYCHVSLLFEALEGLEYCYQYGGRIIRSSTSTGSSTAIATWVTIEFCLKVLVNLDDMIYVSYPNPV